MLRGIAQWLEQAQIKCYGRGIDTRNPTQKKGNQMLDLWEIISAPDQYVPGTFEEEMRKFIAEGK